MNVRIYHKIGQLALASCPLEKLPGSDPPEDGQSLLSHKVSQDVPSARTGLTALFEMGRGVALAL
jgi:hypothetical protein